MWVPPVGILTGWDSLELILGLRNLAGSRKTEKTFFPLIFMTILVGKKAQNWKKKDVHSHTPWKIVKPYKVGRILG